MTGTNNTPPHYDFGDPAYEPDTVIAVWDLGFRLGNVLKYVARADRKGAAIADLEKAAEYLAREIKARKAQV